MRSNWRVTPSRCNRRIETPFYNNEGWQVDWVRIYWVSTGAEVENDGSNDVLLKIAPKGSSRVWRVGPTNVEAGKVDTGLQIPQGLRC